MIHARTLKCLLGHQSKGVSTFIVLDIMRRIPLTEAPTKMEHNVRMYLNPRLTRGRYGDGTGMNLNFRPQPPSCSSRSSSFLSFFFFVPSFQSPRKSCELKRKWRCGQQLGCCSSSWYSQSPCSRRARRPSVRGWAIDHLFLILHTPSRLRYSFFH